MTKTILVLMIAAILVLGGCGKKSDEAKAKKAQEKAAAKANVSMAKGKMTIQTKDGEKVEFAGGGAGVKVPDDFPKDVLVYKGAKVETSLKTGDATQVMLSTADATDKVADAYKAEMTKSGWKEKTSMQMPDMTMLEYAKDRRTVTVQVMNGDGKGAKIVLTIAKDKEAEK